MALDKLVDSAQLDSDLTSVADAIRTKGGTSAQLAFPAGFVSAVEAIQTGGGGETSGYVELANLNTSELVIPVDVSAAQSFTVTAYVDRTGAVVNGETIMDNEPVVHEEFQNGSTLVWYVRATEISPTRRIMRDGSNYSSLTNVQNVNYLYAYRGNNGGSIGLVGDVKSASAIKIVTYNGTRFFCRNGCYVRFAYTVTYT